MASYFNRTRGVITISLRNGDSAAIPPKGKLIVTPEQDRSSDILAKLRKGLLIPIKGPEPVQPAPEPEPEPAPAADPPPAPETSTGDDPAEDDDPPSMSWTKSRLLDHAEAMGLDASASMTKADLLEAIEEAG